MIADSLVILCLNSLQEIYIQEDAIYKWSLNNTQTYCTIADA